MADAAMTGAKRSSKAFWLEWTGELLAEVDEAIAADTRAGRRVPQRRLDVAADIRATLDERSKWSDDLFQAWMDAPSPGEMLDS
jgi:hypothetical protein